jgi:hypothetical protein
MRHPDLRRMRTPWLARSPSLGVIRIVFMTVRRLSASRGFNSPLHAFVFGIAGGDGLE